MKSTNASSLCLALFDRISEIAYSSTINELALARIEQEVEQARESDPVNYLFIRAAASCLRADEASCREYHHRAIEYEPGVIAYYNYAISLSRLGRLLESLSYAQKALDLAPTDQMICDFKASLLTRIQDQMWEEMDDDTDAFLSEVCMTTFQEGEAHA
jgi:tetratricopeptide (TPR) repeat protein